MIGKKKMDYKVYEKLCELLMKEEDKKYLFAHCFLTEPDGTIKKYCIC